MNKAPAFQFYPSDFLSDENVALMTNQEVGCYIKLLCYCWKEGSVPSDIKKLARLCGEPEELMAELWLSLKPCFKIINDGGGEKGDGSAMLSHSRAINMRLDKERKKQEAHRKERSRSGQKGAKTRWGKGKKKDSLAITQPLAEPIAENGSSSSSSSSLNDLSKDKSNDSKNQPEIDFKKPTKKQKKMPSAAKADFLKNDSDKKTNNHFSEKVGSFFESIKKSCEIISKLPQKNGRQFNPYQWVQKHINEKRHPGAVDEVLKAMSVVKYWNGIRGDPYAYANSILKTKNQNWNEKESIAIHNELKNMDIPILSELTSGLFKEL